MENNINNSNNNTNQNNSKIQDENTIKKYIHFWLIFNLSNVSHNIKKVWWDGNNLMGNLELLNTPSGKIAMELVSAGIPLGISSRGMGSVKQLGETVEVQDDFELLCWDLVSVPSTPQAYMQLAESKQFASIKDYSKVNDLITEIICAQTGVCPLC